MHVPLFDLFRSPSFWSGFCAWLVAQMTKMLISFTRTRKLDFGYLVSIGGMPSAHSAMACGLAASVGINRGFSSDIAVVAVAFAIVVMFDATTVRRAAGQQARLLNEIVQELKEKKFSQHRLAEFLGHTRLEIFLGMIMGILVALLVNAVFLAFGWVSADAAVR